MTAFEIGQAPKPLNNLLDSYVAMVSGIVDLYSAKQAEVVFLKLLGFKEIEISERVGISQSSVNTRAANAQWGLLNTAIKDFEALEIEQIS
jgi:DNA-directed RNA polymerase specialized sigma24 family protein